MGNWRTANPPQIVYQESSFDTSSIRQDMHSATRHVQINGVDENDFKKSILGYSVDNGDNTISRFPPEYHPDKTWLRAISCDFVQFIAAPGRADIAYNEQSFVIDHPLGPMCNRIEMSIEYGWPEDGVQYLSDDENVDALDTELWRYVGRRVEYDVISQPIPKAQLIFKSDGLATASAGIVVQSGATLYYTWYQIPADDDAGVTVLPGNLEANIAATVGCVNSVTFDGYPPNTLLCLAPKRQLLPMSDGTPAFKITYIFGQRGFTDLTTQDATNALTSPPLFHWNRSLRGVGKYDQVVTRNGGNPLYVGKDFKKLFQLA